MCSSLREELLLEATMIQFSGRFGTDKGPRTAVFALRPPGGSLKPKRSNDTTPNLIQTVRFTSDFQSSRARDDERSRPPVGRVSSHRNRVTPRIAG